MDMNKVEEIIDKMMDSLIQKMPEEKQPFAMGFTINFDSRFPLIEEINEIENEADWQKKLVARNLSGYLAEAHYFKDEVVVSFELPKKISSNDLSVEVDERKVCVKARKHNFFKKIFLKKKINPKKFSSSFKNSFLELTFKLK
jgi:HSP20 family molecular chaperone IbpA